MNPRRNSNDLARRIHLRALAMALWSVVGLGCAARPSVDVPYASTAPQVSADPADPAWDQAVAIDGLSYCIADRPPSGPPSPTRVLLAWDDDFLYIRFICREDDLFAPFGKVRDATHYKGDVVEVFVDPAGDGRQYIEVQVSPAGGVFDVIHFVTTDRPPDEYGTLPRETWTTDRWSCGEWNMPDLRWAVRTDAFPDGGIRWITDLALPAEPLLRRRGMSSFAPMSLRANFLRYDGPVDRQSGRRRRLVGLNWSPVRLGLPHLSPASMGSLNLAPPASGLDADGGNR